MVVDVEISTVKKYGKTSRDPLSHQVICPQKRIQLLYFLSGNISNALEVKLLTN
jgi:hypothetical protein